MTIRRLDLPKCKVGEGPVWDAEKKALYYIDILAQKVFRWDPVGGGHRSWDVPEMIGSMALRKGGGAIVALVSGIHTLDFETGAVVPFALLDPANPEVQLADGKVDRAGRFIFGTSHRGMKEPLGGLFVLDVDGELRQIDDDIHLGNGPCWSPDNATLYHSDSLRHTIYAYDYDIETGSARGRRLFFDSSAYGPIPDGATVDAQGNLWVAICDGGAILCLSPDGEVVREIAMPVRLPASCMFIGENLDQLFVPSIDPGFLGRSSSADDGASFLIEGLGVAGLPEPRYAG